MLVDGISRAITRQSTLTGAATRGLIRRGSEPSIPSLRLAFGELSYSGAGETMKHALKSWNPIVIIINYMGLVK